MKTRNNKGFTLIELLIVVAIIGIVAAIAIPNLLDAMNRARFKATQGDLRSIGEGIESYRVDERGRVPLDGTFNGLADRLDALDYMKNPPREDGWGAVLTYDIWASNLEYSISSPGSDGAFTSGARNAQILYDDGGAVARESRNWDCDIVFQNGQFAWGGCV